MRFNTRAETGTSSINWVHFGAFSPEGGDKIHSPKRVSMQNKTMDNIKKHNDFINIQPSQTFRSHSHTSVLSYICALLLSSPVCITVLTLQLAAIVSRLVVSR
jgi:hypothetical protein